MTRENEIANLLASCFTAIADLLSGEDVSEERINALTRESERLGYDMSHIFF